MPFSNREKQARSRQRNKAELERLREVERLFMSSGMEDLISRVVGATDEQLTEIHMAVTSEQERRRVASGSGAREPGKYTHNPLFGAF